MNLIFSKEIHTFDFIRNFFHQQSSADYAVACGKRDLFLSFEFFFSRRFHWKSKNFVHKLRPPLFSLGQILQPVEKFV